MTFVSKLKLKEIAEEDVLQMEIVLKTNVNALMAGLLIIAKKEKK